MLAGRLLNASWLSPGKFDALTDDVDPMGITSETSDAPVRFYFRGFDAFEFDACANSPY
jgi:hypothetical protein